MISQDFIVDYIISCLSSGKRGKPCRDIVAVVRAILYRLKTGCQWRYLPMRQWSTTDNVLTYQTVYYHFRRWVDDGSFRQMWISILSKFKHYLDLSNINLDGSLTPALNGGEEVGFQGRISSKATNMLFLTDNQGIVIAASQPVAGNHHDLYNITEFLEQLWSMLREAGINLDGLFLNADAGFDADSVRQSSECQGVIANLALNERNGSLLDRDELFDDELYKRRYVIERTNAWIDGCKGLILRYETLKTTWFALHLVAMSVMFLRKICKKDNSK